MKSPLGDIRARSRYHRFFCPQCRAERRVTHALRPGNLRHAAQIALTTAVATLALWPWLGLKGVIVFLPLWIGFETVYRLRTRTALRCPHCGFDPFLYLTNVKAAREEVESFWKERFAERGIPYPEKGAKAGEAPANAPKTLTAPESQR